MTFFKIGSRDCEIKLQKSQSSTGLQEFKWAGSIRSRVQFECQTEPPCMTTRRTITVNVFIKEQRWV